MAVQLTNLFQHANNVGTGQATDNKQIFINAQGDISGRSGLGFFQRHFSASARAEENRATVDAFRTALLGDARYRDQMGSANVTRFFHSKLEHGTPLTAREVQQAKTMLDMRNAASVGRELAAGGAIHPMDANSFAWFCVGKGLPTNSPEATKEALKAYYASEFEAKARTALSEAGVKAENLDAALKVLQCSSAWTSALDGALEGNLSEITHDGIMDKFGSGLETAANLLRDMISEQGMGNTFLRNMAAPNNKEGMASFNGALEAIRGGAVIPEEGSRFVLACVAENFDLSTPELLNAAIGKYCLTVDAERIFTNLAADNGLPAGVGKALAHNPEFMARAGAALADAFPPPQVPTRADIDKVIDNTAAVFLEDKNDAIRDLLSLAGKSGDFAPALATIVGTLDEKSICEMLNPLLQGQSLLDRLLVDTERGPDEHLVRQLQDFQSAVASCQHMVAGDFGASDAAALTEKTLAVLLGARGGDANASGVLLDQVNRNFTDIGRGLSAMNGAIIRLTLKSRDPAAASAAIGHAQNAMRMVAGFAHRVATPQQKEALRITADAEAFHNGLEFIPSGGMAWDDAPLNETHQAVRAFGAALGVQIGQELYPETSALADSESVAFAGTTEQPAVTDLLRNRAGAMAAEIGLSPFDPGDLDPEAVGTRIQNALWARGNEALTPAEARVVAEQAIREHLAELKPALDFVNGLATQPVPGDRNQLVVSPEEKQRLLRIIPGSPLRSPEMIKTVLLESRALEPQMQRLAVPGLTRDDMAGPLMRIAAEHMQMIGPFGNRSELQAEASGAFRAALALTLDSLQLSGARERELFTAVAGEKGLELGRACACLADLCVDRDIPKAGEHQAQLLCSMNALNHLRMLLGPRVGEEVEEEPFYYTEPMDVRDIPGIVHDKAERVFSIRAADLPGFAALAAVTPKLTGAEWNTLQPLLQTVGNSIPDNFDRGIVMRMVSANAPELLEAARANPGRPLSPDRIWRTVIGGRPPRDLSADNLGARMYETGANRLFERARALNPDADRDSLQNLLQFNLGRGIPFQTLYKAFQPGGRITLADIRLDPPALSSLRGYTEDNAYGLVADWQRRKNGPDDRPSMLTIENPGGDGSFVIPHVSLSEEENVADNPIFAAIMDYCRGVCRSELQFQRVVQSLSQASTVNLRLLAECLPGQTTSEHGHMDSTVRPQPNEDVVVELANGPDDRPFGAHIRITVTPEGEATIDDIGVELRG
ncbi:MAG: hypothetical protein LBJ82_03815 [Deltaproteobacteria bacterium]|jgi:hypothetical protein|nr:hypothetical protein [Deltaproteobacteria bacterium]